MQPEDQILDAYDMAEVSKLEEILKRIIQHQEAGRYGAAGTLLDELLSINPDHPRLLHYKGLNMLAHGEKDEGLALMKTALEAAPRDAVQLADIGAQLATDGDLDAALEYFHSAVETAPNYAIAQSNLGGALVLEKNFRQAIAHLEKAIELDPNLIDAHTNLATAYLQVHQFEKAIDVLFKSLAIDPQSVGAHISLSHALYRRERHEAAEHHARRALELNPNAAEAYFHLGNALMSSGKIDEAAQTFLKIAGRPPLGLAALSRLIHMRKTTEESEEFAFLKGALQHIDRLSKEARCTLHFAAGKAFDDLKNYDLAFKHFYFANEISKTLHPFQEEIFVERTDRLADFCSPALISRCAGGGVEAVAPIFICGMPRSGTTLMDQMFSRHPAVQAGGELRSMPQALGQNQRLREALGKKLTEAQITSDDFARLGEDYVSAVRREGIRSEFLSDKMPANYQYIGLIALALPRAKFLIMRRHPLDNLLSNYFQNFGQNQPFSSDFGHLATVYRKFDEMARRWAERMPDRVRQVSYESVAVDTEEQMRDILDFVGLDWSADVLDFKSSLRQVNTASAAQVREEIYSRAVGRWRNYARHLRPLGAEMRGYLTQDELDACGVLGAN